MRKKRKLRARAAADAERAASGDGLDAAADPERDPSDDGASDPQADPDSPWDGEPTWSSDEDDDETDEEGAADDESDDDEEPVAEPEADEESLAEPEADEESLAADVDADDEDEVAVAGADGDADPDDEAGSLDADAESPGGESDGVEAELAAEPDAELSADPDAELAPAYTVDPVRLRSILESLLFAAEKPLTPNDLRRLTGCDDAPAIKAALGVLMEDYRERGVALYDVAGGYQFRTHPSNSEYVQRLIAGRPVRLSRAQLETLSIIAYRQPVTRPEIDEIRGVDSGSTLKVLLDRSLIRVLGKKEEPGRPLLYGTSKEFLEFFNLSELRDLPTLREFHELTEESLREVEALDGTDPGEGAAADPGDGSHARGDGAGGDPDDDDDASAAAPH
jgi:segregation and condensation protein B